MEVAHDIQRSVSRYVTDSLGLTNSYDTWHGECSTVSHVSVSINVKHHLLRNKERR